MGFAAPATEELADTVSVEQYLIRDKDASYLLKIEGNAMQEAGLINGDMVVFERSHSYKAGDIVVILNEDGYHLTYFDKKIGEAQIVGAVTGSFRSYL